MIPRNQSAHDDQDHQKNDDGSNDHSGTPKSDPRPRWGNSMRRGFVAGSDLAHKIMSAVHIGSAKRTVECVDVEASGFKLAVIEAVPRPVSGGLSAKFHGSLCGFVLSLHLPVVSAAQDTGMLAEPEPEERCRPRDLYVRQPAFVLHGVAFRRYTAKCSGQPLNRYSRR